MTQVFYAEKILPQHIEQIQALERRHGVKYYLQEDGDPSHGIKSPNSRPAHLKRDADLLLLIHPPQSPNLSPIEICWNTIKGRLAGRKWATIAQFKADIQAEWDRITLQEIGDRIREMPQRCKLDQERSEIRIQCELWECPLKLWSVRAQFRPTRAGSSMIDKSGWEGTYNPLGVDIYITIWCFVRAQALKSLPRI
jgi:hypothetical protein